MDNGTRIDKSYHRKINDLPDLKRRIINLVKKINDRKILAECLQKLEDALHGY